MGGGARGGGQQEERNETVHKVAGGRRQVINPLE